MTIPRPFRMLIRAVRPSWVRPIWVRVKYRLNQRELDQALRTLRGRYGQNLRAEVSDRDEMLWFIESALELLRPAAVIEYLRSGESMLADVESLLARHGRPLAGTGSFLEFACGCGRFTRFLVCRVPPDRVTVADIDAQAVEFVRATFGVAGLVSAEHAESVRHDARHDVIFVASLFSHLSIAYWEAWARRLLDFLADDGLLVFSTHGAHCLSTVPAQARARLEILQPGFLYGEVNETQGRLAGRYYGAAFVTEEFVRGFFEREGRGEVIEVVPRGLWDFQDLYVVRLRGRPGTGGG